MAAIGSRVRWLAATGTGRARFLPAAWLLMRPLGPSVGAGDEAHGLYYWGMIDAFLARTGEVLRERRDVRAAWRA